MKKTFDFLGRLEDAETRQADFQSVSSVKQVCHASCFSWKSFKLSYQNYGALGCII